MGRPAATVASVLVMVTIIVGLDVVIFRNHFWARLLANVGIVGVCGALYRRSRTAWRSR